MLVRLIADLSCAEYERLRQNLRRNTGLRQGDEGRVIAARAGQGAYAPGQRPNLCPVAQVRVSQYDAARSDLLQQRLHLRAELRTAYANEKMTRVSREVGFGIQGLRRASRSG